MQIRDWEIFPPQNLVASHFLRQKFAILSMVTVLKNGKSEKPQ